MENKTAEGTKACPHCTKEISSRAIRCPYCQADLRTWGWRHPVLTTILLVVVVGIFLNAIGSKSSSSQNTNSTANDLHATVSTRTDGIHITNNEDSAWSDCMVGLNGGTGWGFDNPPYKTRIPLGFQSGIEHTILYTDMSMDDGTVFDPNTHTVNNIVIDCGQGTSNERYWISGPVM